MRPSASPPEVKSTLDPDSQAFIVFGRRPNGKLYAASDGTISGGEHAPGARSTDDEEGVAEAADPMFLAARARHEQERAEAAAAAAAAAAAKRSGSRAGASGPAPGVGGEGGEQPRRRGRGGRRTTTSKDDDQEVLGALVEVEPASSAGSSNSSSSVGARSRSRGGGGGPSRTDGGGDGGGRGVLLAGIDGSMWEVPQQEVLEAQAVAAAASALPPRGQAVARAAAAEAAAAEPSTADTRRRQRGSSGGAGGADAVAVIAAASGRKALPPHESGNGNGDASGSESEGTASGSESPSSAEGLIVSSASALPQVAAAAAAAVAAAGTSGRGGNSSASGNASSSSGSRPGWATPGSSPRHGRLRTVTRPLPRVLFLHTGGTLGMDPEEAFEEDEGHNLRPRAGASDSYKGSLRPGEMLSGLLTMVPELDKFANVDLQVVFNKDSSRVGPQDWIHIAKVLHSNRPHYDAFVVVHGTDTLAYTASALSLMLCGFKKPIVMTGSQLPLRAPRTDARQNLLDSIQVATSAFSPPHVELQEVAVCFGGKLMRGNRTQKVNSAAYQAFDSLTYPYLATLGIDVDWNTRYLLRSEGAYKPRFKLDPRVIRIPVVPGSDPRTAYGDLYGRGVRGVVLEAFGVGNLPDQPSFGWIPWLREQTAKGLQVCLTSQCASGPLQPALYHAGQLAAEMGVDAGPHMTPECAAVKMMFCLEHPDLALGVPLAGEL